MRHFARTPSSTGTAGASRRAALRRLLAAGAGVGAGLAAGCRVLGVLGTHSPYDLRQADWVAESLDSVSVMVGVDGLEVWFEEM